MNNLQYFTVHTTEFENHEALNLQLIDGLNSHIDDESTRKSHHFFGRYENIYIMKTKFLLLLKF